MDPRQAYAIFLAFCAGVSILRLILLIIQYCCPSEKNNQLNTENANNADDTTTMPSDVVIINERTN